jgi:arginyl-tRNA synthetase
MILPIQQRVSDAVRLAVERQFGLAEVPAFAVETPPSRALGDLAITVAFQLARTLRKAPRAIAQDLVPAMGAIEGVERIVPTPNGYLNLFL